MIARRKFNNKKIESPDGVFDSKGEWMRWLFLKEAEREGRILNLRRQVKFTLIPTQYRTEIVHLKTKDKEVKRVAEREITYTADFVYNKRDPEFEAGIFRTDQGNAIIFDATPEDYSSLDTENRTLVVEDFKGFPNDRWPLKKAMMLYFHGIAVREVKKPAEPV